MSKPAQDCRFPSKPAKILSVRALIAVLFGSAAALWGAFMLDDLALDVVSRHSHGISQWVAGEISIYGDWYGVAAIGWVGWGLARRRHSQRWKRLWLTMGICAALAGLSANVIRTLTGRTRPHAQTLAGWYGPFQSRHPLQSRHAFESFPSAHTSVVAGFCAPLGWVALQCRRRHRRLIGLSVSLSATALMAWSRVWVGAHHLSDVVAAALLGWGIALAWVAYRAPELLEPTQSPNECLPS